MDVREAVKQLCVTWETRVHITRMKGRDGAKKKKTSEERIAQEYGLYGYWKHIGQIDDKFLKGNLLLRRALNLFQKLIFAFMNYASSAGSDRNQAILIKNSLYRTLLVLTAQTKKC